MSRRDKLAEWARPYLESGEQIQAVFGAQSRAWRVWHILVGLFSYLALYAALLVFARPWASVFYYVFIVAMTILFILFSYGHDVVVTDRAIVVLDISKWPYRRTARLRLRHSRDFYFGQLSWRKRSFVLDNTKYWVGRRFYKDVATADAALTQMTQYRQ
ncbi:hypothetical protein [Mycobacterium sp.]|uniref:hypothetical protein n=1 Tax=Mycobacterium sp. TaxID=1785 RepID=UPI003C76E459